MITLYRMIKTLIISTKWKLAFWQEFDKTAKKIMEDPEWLAKTVMPALAKVIHESAELERQKNS